MSIAQTTETSLSSGAIKTQNLPPYRQRVFKYLGLWREADLSLKAYGIHYDVSRHVDVIEPRVAAAARSQVADRVVEAEREGDHHGVGFVIIHQGLLANWLLLNWWAHGNICCEALSRSSVERPDAFENYDGAAVACVWELAVIQFERSAWIGSALQENGSIETYLANHLSDGLY